MANAIVQQINAEMEELQKQLTQFKSTVEYLNNAKSHVSKAVDTVGKAEENFNQRAQELKGTYNSFIQLSAGFESIIRKIDTVNFPERLDNIQSTVKDTVQNLNEIKEATITEVQRAASAITQADFDGRFSKLQNGIDTSVKANQDVAAGIHKMQIPEKIDEFERVVTKRIIESYKEIEKNTRQIADDTSKSIFNLNLPNRIDKLDANIAGISSAIQNVQSRLDLIERNLKDQIGEVTIKQIQAVESLKQSILSEIQMVRSENGKKQKSILIVNILSIALIIISFLVLYVVKK